MLRGDDRGSWGHTWIAEGCRGKVAHEVIQEASWTTGEVRVVSDLGRSVCEVVEITVVVSALQRKDFAIQSYLTSESRSWILLGRKTREKEQGQERQDQNFLVCIRKASGAPVSLGGHP